MKITGNTVTVYRIFCTACQLQQESYEDANNVRVARVANDPYGASSHEVRIETSCTNLCAACRTFQITAFWGNELWKSLATSTLPEGNTGNVDDLGSDARSTGRTECHKMEKARPRTLFHNLHRRCAPSIASDASKWPPLRADSQRKTYFLFLIPLL